MIDSIPEFLNKLTTNDLRKRLVIFLHQNQFAMDTANNLAKWLKASPQETEKELNTLVEFKVLEKLGSSYSTIYFYTQDLEIIETIDKFLRYSKEKGMRV